MANKKFKSPYTAIIFLTGGKALKYTYVGNIASLGAKIRIKFGSYHHINIYDRKRATFLKRFNQNDVLPNYL